MKQKERIEQIKAELSEIETYDYDPESTHKRADELLCELLEIHGHSEIVTIFNNLRKWYA